MAPDWRAGGVARVGVGAGAGQPAWQTGHQGAASGMAAAKPRKASYDEGSLDQYLRDISAYPLITREDEIELAQRIRTNDQEALDKLVRSNLRFVVSGA